MAASSTAGGMRLSLRMVRIALTMAITASIHASASASWPLREALGKGAIMMESGPPDGRGSRCQMSSEMNGMNGCRSRRVVSSVSTRVCWVTARATASSFW